MKEYLVVYKLPSGQWSTGFETNDKKQAFDFAEAEEKRLEIPHHVYKFEVK